MLFVHVRTLVCAPDLTCGECVQRQFIIISARSKKKSFANVLWQPCPWAGACEIVTACLCLCVCISFVFPLYRQLPLHAHLAVALFRSLWLLVNTHNKCAIKYTVR